MLARAPRPPGSVGKDPRSCADRMVELIATPRAGALEIDAYLASEDERVVDLSGAAGLNDVLEVRLDKHRAPREVEAIGCLDRHLVVLDADRRIQLLRLPLRILQVL